MILILFYIASTIMLGLLTGDGGPSIKLIFSKVILLFSWSVDSFFNSNKSKLSIKNTIISEVSKIHCIHEYDQQGSSCPSS